MVGESQRRIGLVLTSKYGFFPTTHTHAIALVRLAFMRAISSFLITQMLSPVTLANAPIADNVNSVIRAGLVLR